MLTKKIKEEYESRRIELKKRKKEESPN